MSNYTADVKRAGKLWEIYVPELDRTTQASRLDQVIETVRDLVELITGTDPGQAGVTYSLSLDAPLADRLAAAREQRQQAQELAARATAEITATARMLKDDGYTVRDIGAVLGVSYQRAQQLTKV